METPIMKMTPKAEVISGSKTRKLDTKNLRQLRIKTGVVMRLAKDVKSYKKEAQIQQQRQEKMKEEGKDEYDIMKMGFVIQETLGITILFKIVHKFIKF